MTWIDEKTQFLDELGAYITLCSNINPPPIDYIADLQRIKALASTANESEFQPYQAWWAKVKPDPCSGDLSPAPVPRAKDE